MKLKYAITLGLAASLSAPVLANDSPLIERAWQHQSPIAVSAGVFIVGFPEAPLASYRGGFADFAPPPRRTDGRLDVDAPAAEAYVSFLQERQEAALQEASSLLGRDIEPVFSYQHAFNGMALRINAGEAEALRAAGIVSFIEESRDYYLATDVGPELIGADAIWDGSALGEDVGTRGEGIVVGIIDSGINISHPSFAATSGDGYEHINPLGDGNYIGWCNEGVGNVTDTCNAKLIGGWDFSSDTVLPGEVEVPGMSDENGHGSHVAATVAGNIVESNFGGGTNPTVSGVAPRANIIAYDVCFTTGDGRGSCRGEALIKAVDQVVADGVVDIINYSISGGVSPWTEAVSLGFLNAVDAGIFVSASAGNSGPGPATMGNLQPWVASVAASTHGRFFADASLETADGGSFGAIVGSGPALTADITAPLIFDSNQLGCTAFDPNVFDGGIALILRGSCSFADKVNNAVAAGAVGVVIANNSETAPFGPGGVESTTVPSVMVSAQSGSDLIGALTVAGDSGLSATLTPQTPAISVVDPSLADVVASFSSRGPNNFDTIKPSVSAPGVSILAALQEGGGSGDPAFGLLQGTSMSSPHNAGAAALLKALKPEWSPSEIQSALMLTASSDMRADSGAGIVDATPFDMGAGRIQVAKATATPLIMRETALNFLLADPENGGEPSTLNLAGLSNGNCLISCDFEREFQSVSDERKQFAVSFRTDSDLSVSISPSRFSILPGQRSTVSFTVDAGSDNLGQWKFGQIVLTEDDVDASPDTLFRDRFLEKDSVAMPVTVFAVEPFPIVDVPASVSTNVAAGATGSTSLDIGNTGTAELTWSESAQTRSRGETVVQQSGTTGNAIVSGFFVVDPANTGAYTAEVFQLAQPTSIGGMFFEGFSTGGVDLANISPEIRFYVYPDAGGSPAGNPEDGLNAEVWSATLAVGSPGLTLDGSDIDLDLSAAGLPDLDLPAGTYWLSAAPVVASTASRWNWLDATTGPQIAIAQLITPGAAFGGAFPNWTDLTALGAGGNYSFALDDALECGAPWLSISPTSGAVAAGAAAQSVSVDIDATALTAGDYQAFLCLDSNDPASPTFTVEVNLTVDLL